MAVTEEKIAECVGYYRRLLTPRSSQSASQARDSRLDVIIRRAGAKRRSKQLLLRLEHAFTAAGIATDPRLTDPDLRADERVFVFDSTRPVDDLPRRDGCSFADEAAMQSFVWTNRTKIRKFQELGLKGFKPQVRLGGGEGKIDMLCHRTVQREKELVGIELKPGKPDDRAEGQSQRYLDNLDAYARTHGYDSAYLIVISGRPNKAARARVEAYAAARGLKVTFLLYSVQMNLL
ncbi:MAG: hypothetical protein QG671_1824 [Actinomycetota bacterium]|nr:hypothetical protein [Actinomycetota bacterium]